MYSFLRSKGIFKCIVKKYILIYLNRLHCKYLASFLGFINICASLKSQLSGLLAKGAWNSLLQAHSLID